MHLSVRLRSLLALCLIAVAAVACMPTSDAITGRSWVLKEVNGSSAAVPGKIEFGRDGRFTVQPGCNTGGGSYAIKGNTIDFAAAEITAMACGDPADAQEQAVLGVLNADPRFEIETQTGRLRMTAGDTGLVFVTP